MPVFLEDPNQFSKQRLKSELVAHNVALPVGESKKQAYLELYLKYIDKQNTTDFSSDEDEQQLQEGDSEATSVQEAVEDEDLDMMAVRQLTDKELKAKLLKFGVKAGPIIASTRALYEKKLQRLMEPVLELSLNGTGDGDQYSDSEEEEDTGSEHPGPKRVTGVEQDTLSDDTMGVHALDDDNYYYPQCFLPSTRMQVWCEPTVGIYSTNSDRNPDDMLDSTARESQALSSPLHPELHNTASAGIPTGSGVKALHMALEDSYTGSSSTIRTFSITQMLESRSPHSSKAGMERRPSGNGEQTLGLKGPGNLVMLDKSTMTKQTTYSTPETSVFKPQFKADDFIFPNEPVRDVLTEMFPDTNRTATGISATRRRPIKGAAGRPVKFKYPNTPLSPGTEERQELQCHLVPVWIQILVFLTVVCLLYLVYGVMEDNVNNPFAALLDNFSHEAELIEESSAFIAPQDVPVTQDVPIK